MKMEARIKLKRRLDNDNYIRFFSSLINWDRAFGILFICMDFFFNTGIYIIHHKGGVCYKLAEFPIACPIRLGLLVELGLLSEHKPQQ